MLEIVYSITGIGSGVCMIAFTKAQGASYMTSDAAKCVLLPLFWSALHLLVNYRMTCTDPRLPLFAFGLLADVMLVLAFYQIARLLYGRPQPMLLALFGALAAVMSFSDLGGYGLARLMGVTSVAWPGKMLLRSGLSAAACICMYSRSFSCCARETPESRGMRRRPYAFRMLPQMLDLRKGQKMAGRAGNAGLEERDIKTDNPTEAELRDWHRRSGLPLKRFFNTSGLQYKALGLKDRLPEMSEDEQYALLATDGMLVKRPLLIGEDFALPGFREKEWREKLNG